MSKKLSRNARIYGIYRALSYDLFFYYVISFFFLTSVKGLAVSQVLLLESIYPLYGLILQIPINILSTKIGAKKSLILGNLFWILGLVGYVVSTNIFMIVIADIMFCIGTVTKQLTEPAFLIQTLKEENAENEFNKIEGKGMAIYFYVETIAAIVSGYMYTIDPYIPMLLAITMTLIALIIALAFEDKKLNIEKKELSVKGYISEIKDGLYKVIKTSRLQALILFTAFFTGTLGLFATFYKNFFLYHKVSTEQFGMIFAILTIIQGVAAQNQYLFEKRTKNRTLTIVSLTFTLSCVVLGIIGVSSLSTTVIVVMGIAILIIQRILRGTYGVSKQRYLVNFTNVSNVKNVLTANNIITNIVTSMILFSGSIIISKVNINVAYIIAGSASFVILLLILKFMKTRVGLKPEEYVGEMYKDV